MDWSSIDELLEIVDTAEETACAELAAFGVIEQRPQFNWSAKGNGDGTVRAWLDMKREHVYLPDELV